MTRPARMPDWPRMMRRDLAAAYVDMPIAEFERAVADGTLPGPHRVGDKDRWSRAELDGHLERMTGEGDVPDWRKGSKLYGGKAA